MDFFHMDGILPSLFSVKGMGNVCVVEEYLQNAAGEGGVQCRRGWSGPRRDSTPVVLRALSRHSAAPRASVFHTARPDPSRTALV